MTFGSLPREARDLSLTSAGVAKSLQRSCKDLKCLAINFASKYGCGRILLANMDSTGAGTLRRVGGKDGVKGLCFMQRRSSNTESCRGAGDRPVESLWVQIRGEANKGGAS